MQFHTIEYSSLHSFLHCAHYPHSHAVRNIGNLGRPPFFLATYPSLVNIHHSHMLQKIKIFREKNVLLIHKNALISIEIVNFQNGSRFVPFVHHISIQGRAALFHVGADIITLEKLVFSSSNLNSWLQANKANLNSFQKFEQTFASDTSDPCN